MNSNRDGKLLPVVLAGLAAALLLAPLVAHVQPPSTARSVAAAQGTTAAPTRETRAVWISRFDFQTPDELRSTIEHAADANLNVIFFQVRAEADALYTPGLEPWAATLTGTLGQDPGWDPLATALDTAHARGLEVHAWVNVYPAWLGANPPPADVQPTPMYDEFNRLYDQEWIQWSRSGPMQLQADSYLSANPAHPAVSDRVVAVCKDILTRYPVDGLHLDYIRYAGPDYSYDPLSDREYAAAVGQNPDLTRGDWQRGQVTGLVERLQKEVLPVRASAHLTATAWPVYIDRWGWFSGRGGFDAYYQDSQGWATRGTVSAITPMEYSPTVHDYPDRFETLGRDYVNNSGPGAVFLGIGADYDTFAPIAQRIDIARAVGAEGQGLFSARFLEQHNYWADLAAGPYSQPAQPYWP